MSRRLPESVRAAAAALVVATMLTGCALFGGSGERKPPAVEAALTPIGGSAAQGSAMFTPRGDGVTMLVQLNGLAPGRYRVLVHANGNCTSPNGFSAGPPWSPPGAPSPLVERIPIMTTNSEGSATLTVRLAGVTVDGPNGLAGRSVVLHDAPDGPFDARPDVPNARIACGVIGPLHSLF